jgi:hypothetical protein
MSLMARKVSQTMMTISSALVDYPWVALIVAAGFLLLWLIRFRRPAPRRVKVIGALPIGAWVGYSLYEFRMNAWADTVVAPIRVDLLIIFPLLFLVSILGLVRLALPNQITARDDESNHAKR